MCNVMICYAGKCLPVNTAIYIRRQQPFVLLFFGHELGILLHSVMNIYIDEQEYEWQHNFCVGLRASALQQQLALTGVCHCIWVGGCGQTEMLLEAAE